MKHILLSCCAGLLLFSSCKSSKSATDCNVMCTALFAAVTVTITNTGGQAATLDSAYTIRLSNHDTLRSLAKASPDSNVYTVVDDSYQQRLKNTNDSFRFMGFRAGALVADGTFVVHADCCHVGYVSGPKTIAVP